MADDHKNSSSEAIVRVVLFKERERERERERDFDRSPECDFLETRNLSFGNGDDKVQTDVGQRVIFASRDA